MPELFLDDELADMLDELKELVAETDGLEAVNEGGRTAARDAGVLGDLVASPKPCSFCRLKVRQSPRLNAARKTPPWHAGCTCWVRWDLK